MGQGLVEREAAVELEETGHLRDLHFGVGRVGRDLLEKDVMDVDQQLALELEFLPVLEVVLLELLLLVCFGGTAYFGIAALGCRLLLSLISHTNIGLFYIIIDNQHRSSLYTQHVFVPFHQKATSFSNLENQPKIKIKNLFLTQCLLLSI